MCTLLFCFPRTPESMQIIADIQSNLETSSSSGSSSADHLREEEHRAKKVKLAGRADQRDKQRARGRERSSGEKADIESEVATTPDRFSARSLRAVSVSKYLVLSRARAQNLSQLPVVQRKELDAHLSAQCDLRKGKNSRRASTRRRS